MREAVAVDDEADHRLARTLPGAQIDVPHKARPRRFIIDGDAAVPQVSEHRLQDPREAGWLEAAVVAVDHLMGARREKARRELPLLHPDGVLRLVAVALRPGRRQDRLHFQFDPADATQVLLDEGLLVAQLRLIGDVPEDAAAAPAAHRTVGGDAVGRGGQNLLDLPEAVGLVDLD